MIKKKGLSQLTALLLYIVILFIVVHSGLTAWR